MVQWQIKRGDMRALDDAVTSAKLAISNNLTYWNDPNISPAACQRYEGELTKCQEKHKGGCPYSEQPHSDVDPCTFEVQGFPLPDEFRQMSAHEVVRALFKSKGFTDSELDEL